MWDLITLIHTNTHLKLDDMPTIGFEIKRKSKVCGKVFVAKTFDSHYRSPKCSKVAWKLKKDVKDRNAKLEAIARQVSDIREYISVKEAVAMFGVERGTLYRLIKLGLWVKLLEYLYRHVCDYNLNRMNIEANTESILKRQDEIFAKINELKNPVTVIPPNINGCLYVAIILKSDIL